MKELKVRVSDEERVHFIFPLLLVSEDVLLNLRISGMSSTLKKGACYKLLSLCPQDTTPAIKQQEGSMRQKRGAKRIKTPVDAADTKAAKQVCGTCVQDNL
jgi:hypothetical protein